MSRHKNPIIELFWATLRGRATDRHREEAAEFLFQEAAEALNNARPLDPNQWYQFPDDQMYMYQPTGELRIPRPGEFHWCNMSRPPAPADPLGEHHICQIWRRRPAVYTFGKEQPADAPPARTAAMTTAAAARELGVAEDADFPTVRRAFAELSRRYHPDVNPGDAAAEERYKTITAAWNTLRATYRNS